MVPETTSMSSRWTLPEELAGVIVEYAQLVAEQNGASPDLAQDIAQTTVIHIDQAARRNPGLRTLLERKGRRAYVATATRNVLVGYHRSEGRRVKRETASMRDQERLIEDAQLQQLESAVLLEQLSGRLSEQEQVFVHLRWFQGLTIREIAAQMDLSEGRTWHLGQDAITKLRRRLGATG